MIATFPPSVVQARKSLAPLFLAVLSACGGGDDTPGAVTPAPGGPTPAAETTIKGAVVKGPVAGASVCAFGPDKTALSSCVTTGADGSYSIQVKVASGDVIIEASSGSYLDEATQATVALAANQVMRSVVTANGGTVSTQVTPLTTLAYNAAAAAATGRLAPTAAEFETAARQVLPALGIAADFDLRALAPVFGATPNAYGTVLTTLSRMIADGVALSQVLAATQAASLKTAYQAAANATTTPPVTPPVTPPTGGVTASGRLQVTGGAAAAFAPAATGFEVDFGIFQSTSRKIEYRFKSTQGANALLFGSLQVGLANNKLSVSYSNPVTMADVYALSENASCKLTTDCQGVTISTPAGQTHPVTITFKDTKVGKFTLNGAVTGDATAAAWGPQDLPRTTSGKVTLDNVPHDIVWSQNFNNGIVAGAFAFVELDDGRLLSVRMAADGAKGEMDLVAANGLVDQATCRGACPITTARNGNTLALTFANTVLKQSGFQATGTYVLDGALSLGTTTGTLASPSLGNFAPIYSQIQAVNDLRTHSFNGPDAFGVNGGILKATISSRRGTVVQVEIVSSVPGKIATTYRCLADSSLLDPYNSGAFDDVPACAGITLAADGLAFTFNAASLKAGTKYDADRSTASFSGVIAAQGL